MINKTKKGRAGRRIVVLITVLVMIFSVGLFAACDVPDTLQADLDALQTEIVYLYESGGGTEAQLNEKQERIDAFRNGANGTLNADQKQQLDKMQTKVDGMSNGDNFGITAELDVRIRQTIFEYWQSQGREHLTIDDVWFQEFGYYDGTVALRIGYGENFIEHTEPISIVVSDIEFHFPNLWYIITWNNDQFFSLIEAYYKYEFLTREDLLEIHDIALYRRAILAI